MHSIDTSAPASNVAVSGRKMSGSIQISGPRFTIVIHEGAKRIALYPEDDPIRSREIFEYAIAHYEQAGANCRVELYDGRDLVETWLSEEE